MAAAKKPKYPSDPILLPSGRGVLCPQCHRTWDPTKGESPNCIECAAAWHQIESAPVAPE